MMLQLYNLKASPNTKHRKRSRVGRGIAAGQGKTAGRGTKGQKSRTGFRRIVILPNLPKLKGFKSRAEKPLTLNWLRIKDKFKADEKINAKKLIELGVVRKGERFKIVGR